MSSPAIRHLASQVGAISRRDPAAPMLALLRHWLAVERADTALAALDQDLLSERERRRLRCRLDGEPPPGNPALVTARK